MINRMMNEATRSLNVDSFPQFDTLS